MPGDGLLGFCENGLTPCRGMIFMEDLDKLYAVSRIERLQDHI